MPEENKRLAREFYERINRGDLSVIDEHLSDDFADHEETPGIPPTKAGVKTFFEMTRAAFPDFSFNIEDMIAEGDRVAARVTAQGTQRGEFMGVPASGKR